MVEVNRTVVFGHLKARSFFNSYPLIILSRKAPARFRFGFPFSSKTFWVCGHCLVTLSLTINDTLKWLSSLPILSHSGGDSVAIISLFPHLHTPFSSSVIRLMVSVEVKHHVYLPTSLQQRCLHTTITPPPFSPSLISLMFSVAVKHHVHLPTSLQQRYLHTPITPPLLSPSLISLTVSVDVKHHVHLPTSLQQRYLHTPITSPPPSPRP